MASEEANSLGDSLYTDSQYEDREVVLPELEETQIWDSPNVKREVALYTKTRNGKVDGTEHAPFVLPYRWTFATLQACVHDFLSGQLDERKEDIQIDRLYYKKKGNNKSVVALHGDKDISWMLDEYPLTFPTGKKKTGPRSSLITMAVDWSHVVRREDSNMLPITPRRSPRLAMIRSRSPVKTAGMDIFVFEVMHTKQNEPKVSKTSLLLQDFNENCTLSMLKEHLRALDGSDSLYVPANGLFWLRKGSKQMVQLKTENDFASCKDEYREKSKGQLSSIRVACSAIKLGNSVTGSSYSSTRNSKRCLDFKPGDARDLELVAAASAAEGMATKKVKTGENDLWNDVHCTLVRDLEKKGICGRYGVKHLKLWTDLIVEGKSAGVGEEPQWEKYIDQVGVPPKPGRQNARAEMSSNQNTPTTDDLLKAMIIQNQQRLELESKRAETFQNSLLALMANKSPTIQSQMSPRIQMSSAPPSKGRKSTITQYTLANCCNFLESHNLEQFIPNFVQAKVDGPLLATLCNPYISSSILEGMDIVDASDKEAVIKAVKEEMSETDQYSGI